MIEDIIIQKLKSYYVAKKNRDEISSILSFFDIINILSVIDGKPLENIKKINIAWKLLHGVLLSKAFKKSVVELNEEFRKTRKPKIDIKKPKKDILERRDIVKIGDFNSKFKTLYEDDVYVMQIKSFLKKYMKKFEPILNKYLNKEPIEIEIIAPNEIKGDIGISSYDLL